MELKEYFRHPTICPLPWIGVYLEPSGNVTNCSVSQTILGNINNDPIEKILLSENNQRIKQQLLNQVKLPSCNTCWAFESFNQDNTHLGGSNRIHFKNKLAKSAIDLVDDPTVFKLKQIDLRWRNQCNLACVYCDSDLSSSWAHELGVEIKTNQHAIEHTKQFVFDQIKNIEYVYLCGGEPLLMKENSELVELIKSENPNVYIRVNTNLTNIKSSIYTNLINLPNVHWIISNDTIGEYFEFNRYGAKWNSWLNNLTTLLHDIQICNQKLTFNMVWCATTAYQIFDAIDFFDELGIHPNAFFVQPLISPLQLNINILKLNNRIELKEILIKRMLTSCPTTWVHKSYKTMLGSLNVTDQDNKVHLLRDYLHELDNRRGTLGIKLFSNLI